MPIIGPSLNRHQVAFRPFGPRGVRACTTLSIDIDQKLNAYNCAQPFSPSLGNTTVEQEKKKPRRKQDTLGETLPCQSCSLVASILSPLLFWRIGNPIHHLYSYLGAGTASTPVSTIDKSQVLGFRKKIQE